MSTDWIPFELMNAGTRSMVRWIHPGSAPLFTEPFFRDSIAALVGGNAVQKLTPVEQLAEVAPLKSPRGFIFHVARCGSTLVSRSLAALPRHRVISEAGPINQLLLAEGLAAPHRAALLKGLVHALCGSADGIDCFIKFSSWNLLFLEQILTLFPATPWVFVYREPAAVLRSLNDSPPSWLALPQLASRVAPAEAGFLPAMLAAMFEAPGPHLGPRASMLNYSQLPAAISALTTHFGLQLDTKEQQQIAGAGQFDAKQTGQVAFRPRERAPLPAELQATLQRLELLYRQCEHLRTGVAA